MNTVYTFSNGVHVDSSTIEKIKKAYFEIVKKELPEEALNFEVNDFILEEIMLKELCLIIFIIFAMSIMKRQMKKLMH